MKAVAILHVDPEVAETSLEGVSLTKLEDCVLLPLGVPLASDPAQLGARVREIAGPVVDVHREPRGVPLFPDSVTLEATTWAAAIEELGEAADWVQPQPANPMASMEGLLGALGAGGQMPEGMPDLGAMAEQLQGEQGAALLEQAMQMAQQLAQSGALEDFAKAMGGPQTIPAPPPEGMPEADESQPQQGSLDPEMLRQMGLDPEALQDADLEALTEQAQSMMQGLDLGAMAEQAQSMLAQNPELEKQLREQLGGSAPAGQGEADDAGDDGGEEE